MASKLSSSAGWGLNHSYIAKQSTLCSREDSTNTATEAAQLAGLNHSYIAKQSTLCSREDSTNTATEAAQLAGLNHSYIAKQSTLCSREDSTNTATEAAQLAGLNHSYRALCVLEKTLPTQLLRQLPITHRATEAKIIPVLDPKYLPVEFRNFFEAISVDDGVDQ